MSSVTFGSVGDIITVCLLAKSIVEALDDSRGSSAEYQGLVSEIRSLECSLLELELFTRSETWRDASTSASLESECSKLILECRRTLESFQAYLKKYDSSLSKDARTGILRRAGAKIKWQLLAKDTVTRFRSELAGHSNALNMMMITANVAVSLKGLDKQKVSASSTERSVAAQDAALDTLRSEIRNNSELASSMTSMLRTMSQKFSWFTDLLVSVKAMVSQGLRLNLATYRAVISIQHSLGFSMDRSLIQTPFILEDPLGRVSPVHLQFITSWNAFYAVLAARFEGLPGHDKIERREFVLQEMATSREVSGKEPWAIAFRPGASVLMSLVFQRDVKTAQSRSHCPYCGNISERETADDVHCMKCNMIYRRVTEVTEVDQPTIPGIPNHWSQRPSFGRSGFNNQPPKMGPFLKRKRSMNSWEDLSLSEEVRSFKRVRILSNIKRARRAAFASWEDKASWSVTENDQIDAIAGDDRFGKESTSSPKVDSDFRNFDTESAILSGASFYPDTEIRQPGERFHAHVIHSNEVTFESEIHISSASEDIHGSSGDCGRLAGIQERGHDFIWYARMLRLNARRAQVLKRLPGGPILAPISKHLCRVLDFGPSNAWPRMAIRHMPQAQILNALWDRCADRYLLCQPAKREAGGYDLIHMQDWAVAADSLPILPQVFYDILRPGGWVEIEILELQVQRNSCVQLQIFPVMIRQAFSSGGIKGFSTAEGITESLKDAHFVHVRSTIQKIPILGSKRRPNWSIIGDSFVEIWRLALELVEFVSGTFSEPQRSSRLCMIGEIRAALLDAGDSPGNFMNLVRITAQKPEAITLSSNRLR